jgi:hypothetical protein
MVMAHFASSPWKKDTLSSSIPIPPQHAVGVSGSMPIVIILTLPGRAGQLSDANFTMRQRQILQCDGLAGI